MKKVIEKIIIEAGLEDDKEYISIDAEGKDLEKVTHTEAVSITMIIEKALNNLDDYFRAKFKD